MRQLARNLAFMGLYSNHHSTGYKAKWQLLQPFEQILSLFLTYCLFEDYLPFYVQNIIFFISVSCWSVSSPLLILFIWSIFVFTPWCCSYNYSFSSKFVPFAFYFWLSLCCFDLFVYLSILQAVIQWIPFSGFGNNFFSPDAHFWNPHYMCWNLI